MENFRDFSHDSKLSKILTAAVGELVGELVGAGDGRLVGDTVGFGVGELVGCYKKVTYDIS